MLFSDEDRLAWDERGSLVWSELGRQHDTEKNISKRTMTRYHWTVVSGAQVFLRHSVCTKT